MGADQRDGGASPANQLNSGGKRQKGQGQEQRRGTWPDGRELATAEDDESRGGQRDAGERGHDEKQPGQRPLPSRERRALRSVQIDADGCRR